MDVNLFTPINLKILNTLQEGYVVSWDIGAAAKSELAGDGPYPIFIIYGKDANTSNVGALGTLDASSTHYKFSTPPRISEVYITASLDGSESAPSNSVVLLSTNLMPEGTSIAVGKDDSGYARSLSVTPDGVLRVTGTTVNNYGGDASADNQTTIINKLDDVIVVNTTIKTAVDNVTNGLSNVGLNAATVNALQTITIANLPTDYPDSAGTAAVVHLENVLATESTANTIKNNTVGLVKTADLALSSGILSVQETNPVTDFPDSTTHVALQTQAVVLNNIKTNSDSIKAATTSLADNIPAQNTALTAIQDSIASVDTKATNTNSKLDLANTTNSTINSNISDVNTKLASIITDSALNLKTADLALSSGILSVQETNPVTDFPDTDAHTKLDNIDTHIQALQSGQTITFGQSLPAGTNLIGRIDINSLPLPPGASTEATSSAIVATGNMGNSLLNNIKTKLDNIKSDISAILAKTALTSPEVVLDKTLVFNNNLDYRPEAIVTPSLLEKYSRYMLQVFSYDAPITLGLYRESAINSTTYYHPIKGFTQISILNKSLFENEFQLMRNIMLRFCASGDANVKIRITGLRY